MVYNNYYSSFFYNFFTKVVLNINVFHVTILKRINDKGGRLEYKKMSIFVKGKSYYVTTIYNYLDDLEKEKAIKIKDGCRLFEITAKGKILLEKYKELLIEGKKPPKRRSDYQKITPEQKNIFNLIEKYILAKKLDKTRPCVLCKELGITNATVSKHLNNLKNKGYITFEAYRPYTIKILKDIES